MRGTYVRHNAETECELLGHNVLREEVTASWWSSASVCVCGSNGACWEMVLCGVRMAACLDLDLELFNTRRGPPYSASFVPPLSASLFYSQRFEAHYQCRNHKRLAMVPAVRGSR